MLTKLWTRHASIPFQNIRRLQCSPSSRWHGTGLRQQGPGNSWDSGPVSRSRLTHIPSELTALCSRMLRACRTGGSQLPSTLSILRPLRPRNCPQSMQWGALTPKTFLQTDFTHRGIPWRQAGHLRPCRPRLRLLASAAMSASGNLSPTLLADFEKAYRARAAATWRQW